MIGLILIILQVVFLVLKFADLVVWSWGVILIPFWIVLGLWAFMVIAKAISGPAEWDK